MNLKLNLSEESALWRPLFENNYDIMEKGVGSGRRKSCFRIEVHRADMEGDAKSKLQ